MVLMSDIHSYDSTLDPEFCESILDRMDVFNEDCEPKIEILDCG